MSNQYEDLLIQTCTIQRKTTASSTTGTEIATYAVLKADVACLVQIMSKEFEIVEGGEKTPLKYRVFLKSTQDIIESDKITWESKDFLVIQAPPEDPSGLEHHKEIIMEQLT